MKKALITGILGQDGPYLAKHLLEKGYRVYGLIKRYTNPNFQNLDYLGVTDQIEYLQGDLTDECSLMNVVKALKPDEIYNLAAQSFVGASWDQAELTTQVNAVGVLHLLNAIKLFSPHTKFYQASTSEMFGNHREHGLQTEETPFHPRSPYGISKLYGYWITNNYKESYGMFCCNGILFNHESPIRGKEFVTRKVTDGIARIKAGLSHEIRLGNLDSKRDWGFAGDYVEVMHLMMQHETPDNYIVSTGETHSVREFCEIAFAHVGLSDWEKYIVIDPQHMRPAELYTLQGKSDKAKTVLGWQPKVQFEELVTMMMDADMKRYTPAYTPASVRKPISLIKSSFYQEASVKKALAEFVSTADKFSMGEKCAEFENAFAQKQGRAHAVFVNSGSSANLILIQALLNLGLLKKGDRVGFSGLTWATNVMPLIQLGLVPVPVDCELSTLNVSSMKLSPLISSLKALFITNTLGLVDDIPAIKELCRTHNVLLLEDNCESLGSKINGQLLGNFGLASTFSFFVGRHLSAIEGGMICTDDEAFYEMLTMARAHGWARNLSQAKQDELKQMHGVDDFYNKYSFYDLGYNVRPTEINGLIGMTQLAYWDEMVEKRQQNFRRFCEAMSGNGLFTQLKTSHMDTVSNFAMPVICSSREAMKFYVEKFRKEQVEIRPIVAGDITQQPFYKKYVGETISCPTAKIIHKQAFYFPNNPELTPQEVETLCRLLRA